MAKNPEKVMEFVKQQLASNPEILTSELHERAKTLDPGVEQLSLRQFNARFPLQVKRKQTQARRKSRKPAAGTGPSRVRGGSRVRSKSKDAPRQVRNAFLRFAEELTSAEERQDFVRVLAGVDRYVDEVIEATGD